MNKVNLSEKLELFNSSFGEDLNDPRWADTFDRLLGGLEPDGWTPE